MTPDIAAALVAESATQPGPVVDYLLDHEVTPAEILLMYAGEPPEWEGGLSRECLVEWLARKDPPDERAGKVQKLNRMKVIICPHPTELILCPDRNGETPTAWRTESAARRYLKRRVLSLFPEVTVTLRSVWMSSPPIGRLIQDIFPECRRDLHPKHRTEWVMERCGGRFVQVIPVSDWIPPHEEERTRGAQDFRAEIIGVNTEG